MRVAATMFRVVVMTQEQVRTPFGKRTYVLSLKSELELKLEFKLELKLKMKLELITIWALNKRSFL